MSSRAVANSILSSAGTCSLRPSAIASSSRLPFFPSTSRGIASDPSSVSSPSRSGRQIGSGRPSDSNVSNATMLGALRSIDSSDPLKPKASRDVGAGAIFAASTVQQPRPIFRPNTLYHPGDLSKQAWDASPRPIPKPPLLGPSAPASKLSDPFHILSINPHDEVLNTNITQAYISQMGKIKTRAETGLTWKNQRRMGKAVRRARSMGLISRWSSDLQAGTRGA